MSKKGRSKKITKKGLSRRNLLKMTGAGLSAVGAGVGIQNLSHAAQNKPVKLDVQEVNGLPTYNGKTPGPTISVNPGESFDVHLINSLPALDDDCVQNVNAFHGLNTTNLHTHGLHVSPSTDSSGEFDSDNVFINVVPKDQIVPCEILCGEEVKHTFRSHEARYRFELLDNHPGGTHWYHAHKHGSTARQVGAGLAGPLIVKDPAGYMPDYIEQAAEKILMITNRGVILVDPDGGGQENPTISMRPGEVQRWRIINAQAAGSNFAYLRPSLEDVEIYQIAFDGITLPRRVKIDRFEAQEPWLNPAALAPGNRTDLLIRVPADAPQQLLSVGVDPVLQDRIENDDPIAQFQNNNGGMGGMGGGGMGGMGGGGMGGGGRPSNFQVNLEIKGSPIDHPWSDDDQLPGPGLKPFGDEKLPPRKVTFSGRVDVDGERFTGQVKQTMKLGTEEEWTVTNNARGIHAFHIHVNPLFITHINGEELPKDSPLRRWQDTIGISTGQNRQPGSVTYKTRFETYRGKFVIHCHILRHEDLGMMQTVEVV